MDTVHSQRDFLHNTSDHSLVRDDYILVDEYAGVLHIHAWGARTDSTASTKTMLLSLTLWGEKESNVSFIIIFSLPSESW